MMGIINKMEYSISRPYALDTMATLQKNFLPLLAYLSSTHLLNTGEPQHAGQLDTPATRKKLFLLLRAISIPETSHLHFFQSYLTLQQRILPKSTTILEPFLFSLSCVLLALSRLRIHQLHRMRRKKQR